MENRKKVAFFVAGLNTGGIENYLLRFLTFYKESIEATVYCKSGNTGDLENEYRAIGVNVVKFKIGYISLKDVAKLIKELARQNYDGVVDFTGNFAAIPLKVAKSVGIEKRIVWYRNADDKFKKSTLRVFYNKIINKITHKNATAILSNSKAALDYFYKDYRWQKDERFEVIYNGLDANVFLSTSEDLREEFKIPEDAFVVGNVGRLNEQKNHKTAIQVAVELCKENEDIYFIFCGKGVDAAYSDFIKEHKLQQRVILTGMRRDVIRVLNTMDCFYFPSVLEGQPNALIEAMVVGIPFVASDIEPVKETIPQDLCSYLVPPLDKELAKSSILKIKQDTNYRNNFIVKDWAIRNFNSEVQFKKFYDKIKK